LYKDAIELAECLFKSHFSRILIISSKDNQLGDSADDIYLSGIPQLV
jgi:hypothetical protein